MRVAIRECVAVRSIGTLAGVTASTFRGRVWAKPGARRPGAGGAYGEPAALIVRVSAPAADGAANAAVVDTLAAALGVGRNQVVIVRGRRARLKHVDISDPPPGIGSRWRDLLWA